ncbi:NADH dehydrogenase, alpha subcomplex, subunit 8 [Aspergillus campestris IBT 28561]|uniref:NADH-ubiquinone oxidoreductase n=1 Tax=Aspergillus campestris (strain IBT 28561) TaxID=1392248 RepID=A0A2I1DFZ7_ASPC2|nr:NADH dehydrogenase, alpha subcomplex, subunit 8 [Aspergillus campestris IBT 28561]PKY08797.1 NADH dehydrogenase, alpha subcomplex, subunit 8 [Aspergillus campestris IBT 28561]
MSRREPQFNQQILVDTTPMPDHIPKVEEIGTTSAPLTSAAYFIGDRCKAFNDDYMKCKVESNGRGELECLKEGRKVTRCAASVIKDINTHCLQQFNAHWECLENNNHRLWECRKAEMNLNSCVFEKLGLKKTIPGTPENVVPVHLRPKQKYAQHSGPQW